MRIRMRTEVAKGYRFYRGGSSLRNATILEFRSGIDHMEVNRDCVIGEIGGGPRRITGPGESVREPALPLVDLLGGGLVTTLATAGSGRAGKGDSGKGEDDCESDRETENHVRQKMTNEGDKNEGEGCVGTARDIQEWWMRRAGLYHAGLYILTFEGHGNLAILGPPSSSEVLVTKSERTSRVGYRVPIAPAHP